GMRGRGDVQYADTGRREAEGEAKRNGVTPGGGETAGNRNIRQGRRKTGCGKGTFRGRFFRRQCPSAEFRFIRRRFLRNSGLKSPKACSNIKQNRISEETQGRQ